MLSLERVANGVLIVAAAVVLLGAWPLAESITQRWRDELARTMMGPVVFPAPTEFALAEGRVVLSVIALGAVALGATGLTSGRRGALAPTIGAVILLATFGLWVLTLSPVW